MAEQTLNFLKRLGVTPASLFAFCAFAGAWYQTISPIPSEMARMTTTIQDLGTKVEVHSVLIAQMADIRSDVSVMRKELSTIEGRLAHLKAYANP